MKLYYSILQYTKDKTKTENIKLAILFHIPEISYRDFSMLMDWKKIAKFNPTLDIGLLKDVILDMRNEILNKPLFDFKEFYAKYQSELYFCDLQCIEIPVNVEN